MRDYTNIERYLNTLLLQVYDQPEDAGHAQLAEEVINAWFSNMTTCRSVLDVGAGTGFCQPMFEKHGIAYEGVALGNDWMEAQKLGRNVKKMDFSFLDYPDDSFDMVFSRHSLEHSPMPIVTLMEWRRVSRQWCGVILPAPEHYTYIGKNHYSVMSLPQARVVFEHAGWKPIWETITNIQYQDEAHSLVPYEYRIMLEKIR